jgi:hypothetical protein
VTRSDGSMIGLAFALWCGPLAAAVVAASFTRTIGGPGGPAGLIGDLVSQRRAAPLRAQVRMLRLPGPTIWAIPAVLAVPVLVSVPFSAEVAEGDWSILAGAAFVVLLLGPLGLLAGALVWLLVGLPLLALVGSLRPGSRPGARAFASGMALLLAGVAVFATTLVLGAPDADASSNRAARIPQLLALLGLNDAIVEHPALLWVARASVLIIVAGGVLLARGARRRRSAAPLED